MRLPAAQERLPHGWVNENTPLQEVGLSEARGQRQANMSRHQPPLELGVHFNRSLHGLREDVHAPGATGNGRANGWVVSPVVRFPQKKQGNRGLPFWKLTTAEVAMTLQPRGKPLRGSPASGDESSRFGARPGDNRRRRTIGDHRNRSQRSHRDVAWVRCG